MRHSRVQAMEELEKAMQAVIEAAAARFAKADTGVRIVGPQEIATLHCSPTSTAWRWKGRRRLPDPTWSVSGHDMWDLDVIEQWSRQTGRWHPAVRRWAGHLDRMVLVRGTDLRVPDPSLDFAELYDLLGLGREKTRLDEIGMPPADTETPDEREAAEAEEGRRREQEEVEQQIQSLVDAGVPRGMIQAVVAADEAVQANGEYDEYDAEVTGAFRAGEASDE